MHAYKEHSANKDEGTSNTRLFLLELTYDFNG